MSTLNELEADLLDYTAKRHTSSHKRGTKGNVKHIRVRSSVEVAKDNYKEAKKLHKKQIKTLKKQIRSHKLLTKQAYNQYRIIKLSKA